MLVKATRETDTVQPLRLRQLIYRLAKDTDDKTLRTILRDTPTTSWVTLSTEYDPSYFASSRLFGLRHTIIAEWEKPVREPVGMCCYTDMPVHINGSRKSAAYLAELRVLPAFRNKFSVIKNGFSSVRHFAGEAAYRGYWFTSIASENTVARRLLEANLPGMPIYNPLGELVTMAISARTGRDSIDLSCAKSGDIPELINFYNRQAKGFQFSPALHGGWLRQLDGSNGLVLQDFWLLRHGASIKACFALWDQRAIKQTVVRGYRFPLDLLRQPINVASRISGHVRLPAIGEKINYVFIAFLAIDKSIQAQLPQVINSALCKLSDKHAEVAMLGIGADNPLLKRLDGFARRTYRSSIDSVSWPDQSTHPKGAGPAIQSGIVQPEIALL